MVNKLLLLMLIGHLLGDFYFQTPEMAKRKDEKFEGILIHSLEYFISALIVMIPVISIEMVGIAVYMSVFHLLIGGIKYGLIKKKKIKQSAKLFVSDQALHVLSIFFLAYIMMHQNIQITKRYIFTDICSVFDINALNIARWILSILTLHIPSNILIQNLLSGYKPRESKNNLIEADNKVGRKIGTIERLIMLMFASVNQYAAMGLVLTAKSIARYDKITKNEKFAEYYLLGTLLSTACVVFCKIVILK